ncbi:hypothetical protein HNP38_002681 [Chryseobacterium defluvii]|uniref:Uncharacterized protein n=1 Tax=Chryseobacterium defluvii TaxID=160396 RepID=A0A840KHF9_9FLAO|nr:NHLP leader peptide family RiPP precursor [Chryseobacterium defluvii]MBB4807377.1 hypothetical protein [Chryseobacterium defluvii]
MEQTKNQEVLQRVLERAWEDAEFKKELVASPMAAIEKLTGEKLELPIGKRLVILDTTDESVVYLKIPTKESLEAELTDEQLEMVAGGVVNPVKGGGLIVSCMAGCDGDSTLPWLQYSLPG